MKLGPWGQPELVSGINPGVHTKAFSGRETGNHGPCLNSSSLFFEKRQARGASFLIQTIERVTPIFILPMKGLR